MKPSDEMMSMLYNQLGRVFFLVAYADKHVHEKEIQALKESIGKFWLDYDETFDEFSGDTAFHIEYTFDYLVENPKSENAILSDFIDFVNDYDSLFTKTLCKMIIETCEKIADAYAGVGPEELAVINKIKAILA